TITFTVRNGDKVSSDTRPLSVVGPNVPIVEAPELELKLNQPFWQALIGHDLVSYSLESCKAASLPAGIAVKRLKAPFMDPAGGTWLVDGCVLHGVPTGPPGLEFHTLRVSNGRAQSERILGFAIVP